MGSNVSPRERRGEEREAKRTQSQTVSDYFAMRFIMEYQINEKSLRRLAATIGCGIACQRDKRAGSNRIVSCRIVSVRAQRGAQQGGTKGRAGQGRAGQGTGKR